MMALVFAAGMTLSLAACGSSSADNEPEKSPESTTPALPSSLIIEGKPIDGVYAKCQLSDGEGMIGLHTNMFQETSSSVTAMLDGGNLTSVTLSQGEESHDWNEYSRIKAPEVTVAGDVWTLKGQLDSTTAGTIIDFESKIDCTKRLDTSQPYESRADGRVIPVTEVPDEVTGSVDHLLAADKKIFTLDGKEATEISLTTCFLKGGQNGFVKQLEMTGDFDEHLATVTVNYLDDGGLDRIHLLQADRKTKTPSSFMWISLQKSGPAFGKEGKKFAVGGTMANSDGSHSIELSTECDEFRDYEG